MGLKNDRWIIEQANKGMIKPFVPSKVNIIHCKIEHLVPVHFIELEPKNVISYGVSSYGYDFRVANEFKFFTNIHNGVVDPKHFAENVYIDKKCDVDCDDSYIIIPPNSFALSRSVEYFRIPRGILGICMGKSTYARCGIIVNLTAFEPEWEGHVTIEISNTTTLPAKVYVNEGIAQVLFLEADELCMLSYKDRNGKYQGQTGITLPKV